MSYYSESEPKVKELIDGVEARLEKIAKCPGFPLDMALDLFFKVRALVDVLKGEELIY